MDNKCVNCKFMGRYQRIGGEEILNFCLLHEDYSGDIFYQEISDFDATNCLAFMTKEI